MSRKILFMLCILTGITNTTLAQLENFKGWYPVAEESDIQYKTTYVKQETILFEANPYVRFGFYNDMARVLANDVKKHAQVYYIAFKPQLRMYTDSSLPVKTPTYKAQAGVQHLFKLRENRFFSVALESGHFSNGQHGSAFSDLYVDGSAQGDSMYTLINDQTSLSNILNRRSGNFSTNLTELNFNYRSYHFRGSKNIPDWTHSVTLGFVLYHDKLLGLIDLGGYSDDDIKIYGQMRYQAGYEATYVFPRAKKKKHKKHEPENARISFSERIQLIQGAHPSVQPLRSETRISFAPGGYLSKDFQVFVGLIVGHDNYNYRFVDAGTQFAAGISWSVSPPIFIGRRTDTREAGSESERESVSEDEDKQE
jgi:hypothetical protein